jgi:hypothetical protein
MIKHDLIEWPGVAGPKKAWWYKMQLFNSKAYSGKLLYLDLDVVITGNLDWIPSLDERYFWCAKDFKYLWRPNWTGINSSVMYWDTHRYRRVWKNFKVDNLPEIMKKYPGDQDYITAAIDLTDRKFMEQRGQVAPIGRIPKNYTGIKY